MQHVEPAEGQAPGAHFLHRRLVFVAPCIGERRPVERDALRRQQRLGLARDRAAPVDQGAEHVEDQRLDGHASQSAGRIALMEPRSTASAIGSRGVGWSLTITVRAPASLASGTTPATG